MQLLSKMTSFPAALKGIAPFSAIRISGFIVRAEREA